MNFNKIIMKRNVSESDDIPSLSTETDVIRSIEINSNL